MRRNWLRPKVYVVQMGNGMVGTSVWPDSLKVVYPPFEPRICVRCGTDLQDATGFALPAGLHCEPCDRIVRPPIHVTRARKVLRKVWWPIHGRYDSAYWAYAQRFGKRIYR